MIEIGFLYYNKFLMFLLVNIICESIFNFLLVIVDKFVFYFTLDFLKSYGISISF